jgi:hypothetical protein
MNSTTFRPRAFLRLLTFLLLASALIPINAFAADTTPADIVYAAMSILPEKWRAGLFLVCPLLVAARFAGKILCTAFHEYCLSTETKKDDEFLDHIQAALAPLARIGFWIDLLLSVKSASAYRGPATAAPTPAPNPSLLCAAAASAA